ncbi:MAG TPA: 23S rRNA pseudouridine synthase F, partial [Chryseobacterium sp.]|nr:23S rRNA pseudouridine synthase F [Chryseobacterium sp.]
KLKRIRIMNIKLDLPVGKWRDLTAAEMKELEDLLGDSEKTVD